MRTYETLYIVSPEHDEAGVESVAKDVEQFLQKLGATIERAEIWGRRRLAYRVGKYWEGSYVLVRFQAKPDVVARLENFFKLNESIIRHLIVYFDEKRLRLEAEQNRRREANIAHASYLAREEEEADFAVSRAGRRNASDEDDEDSY